MIELYTTPEDAPIQLNQFLFPGGEVGLKIEKPYQLIGTLDHKYTIKAHLHNSNDVMSLAMLKNAIENVDPLAKIVLVCPYIPYARQDRVCDKGEAFAIKVFANYLNSLNFSKVTIYDPHSDVTPALINNVDVINQLDIIKKFPEFFARVKLSNAIFISPDAGANKKTSKIAGFFGHTEFLRADKLRDLSNGKILETVVYCDDLNGKDVVILDDICDGGATFIALAEVLRKKNCGKVVLYVTHGIFSRGIEHLLNNGIDEIYTTDSFTKNIMGDIPSAPKFNICKLQ